MSNRQNFTTYTETDTASKLSVTANTITATLLDTDETAYVYKDFTASYFSSDFEHNIEVCCTATDGLADVYLWAVTNSVTALGTLVATPTNKVLALRFDAATRYLTLVEGDGTNIDTTSGTVALTVGTPYYIRICRDETVGTYGTLYAYIYTDSSCCTLVEVISHTLEIKTDFRYLFAFSGKENGTGNKYWSGTVSYLTLEANPYTLQNMITTIRYYLRESTASFWSDAEITSYINRAVRDVSERTGCIQRIDTTATTASMRTVSFNGYRVTAVEYVPVTGRSRYLKLVTPSMVGHVFVGLQNGEPEYWFEEDDDIGIEPLPNDAYPLRLYVADYPTADLSVNTQVPEVPPAFRQIIVWYAVYMALVKDKKFSIAIFIFSLIANDIAYHTMDKVINIPVGLRNLKVE